MAAVQLAKYILTAFAPDAPARATVVGGALIARGARWEALDLFRCLAVVLMVQGHTFNVLVLDSARTAGWYGWHNYLHGYTAPMFMFAAGLAFGVTTLRNWDAHASPSSATRKRLERYLILIAIGYLIHLPEFAIRTLESASPGQIRNLLKVDALQCIGVTLLGIELLVLALKRKRAVALSVLFMGVVAVTLAPLLFRLPINEVVPRFLVGYFTSQTGSVFPLIPWAAFIVAGLLTGYMVQGYLNSEHRHRLGAHLASLGSGLLLAAILGNLVLPPATWGEHNFWHTNPFFFIWRVGALLLLLALLCGAFELFSRRGIASPRGTKFVQTLGRQTLVIYVVHLIILYGSPFHRGVRRAFGHQLVPAEAFAWFLLLFASMSLLALAWGWLQKRRPGDYTFVRLVLLVTVVIYVFSVG